MFEIQHFLLKILKFKTEINLKNQISYLKNTKSKSNNLIIKSQIKHQNLK